MDMMPTLSEQLSLAVPEGVQGVSLVPLIGGQSPAEPLQAMAEGVKLGPEQRAFYQDDWKLMVTLDTGRRQLFNLYNDRLEQIDLSVRNPERLEILTRALQGQVELNEWLAAGFQGRETTLSPDQIERLRSLGYIGD
jgi:arylsulfatase A-like enzyme